MLTKGNEKLGKTIWGWSIPAVTTCPGRSRLCESVCYARDRFFLSGSVLGKHKDNLRLSRRADFCGRMVREIDRRMSTVLRVHVAGDFYSAAYVRKWASIARSRPGVRFYAYTRSWRVPAMRRALAELSRLSNVRLWYSWDKDTGRPPNAPRRVRLAYLMEGAGDEPDRADLAFRTAPVRRHGPVQKRAGGALVCPVENGVTETTCEKCGVCWQDEKAGGRRLALPIVA